MKYDTTKTYTTREEAKKVVKTLRPLKVGDVVNSRGVSIILAEVYYSDVFIEYKNECDVYIIYFMCEFKGKESQYGYYKSYYDGGIVELVE